jgi:hypothetical protein
MSDEVHYPRERSAAEWTYLLRRRRILRAIRHSSLTPAAKQVMVALCVQCDDPFVLPARPPVQALARHLALAERTVRQAICELVEQLCLSFRQTGEFFRPGEGPPADPVERPDLAREWAFLSEARADPGAAEHLAQLARLRDHAVAAKRIATAVSAERAIGRALAEQMRRGEAAPAEQTCHVPAEQTCREDEEAPLGAPDDNLILVAKVNADRALAPAARHALIEVMLDRGDDPVDYPEDDRCESWTARIARRHGITLRGARKALAELAELRLITQSHGDVGVYDNRIEERMRRGTEVPSRLPLCEGLDPLRAHRHRLERLRELALEQGLVSTALAAQRAIGRAVELAAALRPAAPAPPKPAESPVLPFVRQLMAIDPGAGRMVLEVLDEIRSQEPARPSAAAAM